MCWWKEGIGEYIGKAAVVMRGRRRAYGQKIDISRKTGFVEQLAAFK